MSFEHGTASSAVSRKMNGSMRKERQEEAKRRERDAQREQKGTKALEMLREGRLSVWVIAKETSVSPTTVHRIKSAMENDSAKLEKLLNPAANRAGARPVITQEEGDMVTQAVLRAGQRGFSYPSNDLKRVLGKISSDGRPRT